MGVNYYLHRKICRCCKRSDHLHVGKASYGWTFSFRGYNDAWDEPKIESYKQWLDYLADALAKGCELRDEENTIISLKEFKELIERKRSESRNHAAMFPSSKDWLDNQGNSFSGSEFS